MVQAWADKGVGPGDNAKSDSTIDTISPQRPPLTPAKGRDFEGSIRSGNAASARCRLRPLGNARALDMRLEIRRLLAPVSSQNPRASRPILLPRLRRRLFVPSRRVAAFPRVWLLRKTFRSRSWRCTSAYRPQRRSDKSLNTICPSKTVRPRRRITSCCAIPCRLTRDSFALSRRPWPATLSYCGPSGHWKEADIARWFWFSRPPERKICWIAQRSVRTRTVRYYAICQSTAATEQEGPKRSGARRHTDLRTDCQQRR